jgi:hypothetical protein
LIARDAQDDCKQPRFDVRAVLQISESAKHHQVDLLQRVVRRSGLHAQAAQVSEHEAEVFRIKRMKALLFFAGERQRFSGCRHCSQPDLAASLLAERGH